MHVTNVHQRVIAQPIPEINTLLHTLATPADLVWPHEFWPRIRLDKGLEAGSKGGHGPIRYTLTDYREGEMIEFAFSRPKGFHGIHRFDMEALEGRHTKLTHTIDMQTTGWDLCSWALAIRWLHDALIEDLFDKVENQFDKKERRTPWSLWVRGLRMALRP